MQIQLKVDHHPAGRYTLKQREQGEMLFSDVREPPELFANDNMGPFYKAVAARLFKLYAEGHEVTYEDVEP